MSLPETLLTEGYRDPRDIHFAVRADGQVAAGRLAIVTTQKVDITTGSSHSLEDVDFLTDFGTSAKSSIRGIDLKLDRSTS